MDERSEDEIEQFRHDKKISMRKSREEQNEEIRDYQKIENKHKRRLARKNLSREKHLENNKTAKEEMKKLKEEGRLKEFKSRGDYKTMELDDYTTYYKQSKDNYDFLNLIRPDIVSQINERIRKEKEERRKCFERLRSGEACPGLRAHVAWMRKQKQQDEKGKSEQEDEEVFTEDEADKTKSNDKKLNKRKNTVKVSYQ